MTGPRRGDSGQALSPMRRRGLPQPAPAAAPYANEEVARGQADAVLGALGRMQLRLDVLAREQADAFEQVLRALEQLTGRIDALERSWEADADADNEAEVANDPEGEAVQQDAT